jgi:peptide/nickel transport system ATP-binding protein
VGLVGSFPSMHGTRRRLEGIAGSPPDLRQLPGGCSFHPRCRFSDAKCAVHRPDLASVPVLTGGVHPPRAVACWRQDDNRVPAELSLPEPAHGAARD